MDSCSLTKILVLCDSILPFIIATIASRLRLFSRAHALSSSVTSRARLMPGHPPAEMAGISSDGAAGAAGATTTMNANVVGSIASASSLPRRAASTLSSSSPRGAFIVLEGVDRCGKTTQCARLVERLRESGVRERTDFDVRRRRQKEGRGAPLSLVSSLKPPKLFPAPFQTHKNKPHRSRPRCGASRTGRPRSAP